MSNNENSEPLTSSCPELEAENKINIEGLNSSKPEVVPLEKKLIKVKIVKRPKSKVAPLTLDPQPLRPITPIKIVKLKSKKYKTVPMPVKVKVEVEEPQVNIPIKVEFPPEIEPLPEPEEDLEPEPEPEKEADDLDIPPDTLVQEYPKQKKYIKQMTPAQRKALKAGRPLMKRSAYAFFVQMCTDEFRKLFPEDAVNFPQFSWQCGQRWKTMTEEEKWMFNEMASKDKERYDAEMLHHLEPLEEKITRQRSKLKRGSK